MGLHEEKVRKIIEDSSPVEKTRWYKKSLGKKLKNENPFTIYGLLEGYVNYIDTKLYKKLHPTFRNHEKQINQIIHELVQQKNILYEILSLQSVYTDCFSFIEYDVLDTG